MEKDTIKVIEILPKIITSRDSVNLLKKIIEKKDNKLINLDFSKIEFISRSAIHALLVMKEKFKFKKKNKKEIFFTNLASDIARMLRRVAANRAFPKKKKTSLKIKKIDINSL